MIQNPNQRGLSNAALEVLAIVAYRQPITRHEIENIRGASSDNVLRKLLTFSLIEEAGRLEGPGRPILFRTTDDFLDYISKINKDICSSIGYTRIANMNLITKIDGDYKAIGLDIENMDSIDFDDLVGMKFKLVHNNDYYEKTAFKTFMPTSDLKKAYNSKNSITLTIKAIVRENADSCVGMLANGIAYSDKLTELVVNNALNSDIVKEQKKADYNVLTRESLDKESKSSLISYLGGDTTPYALMIYPKNFDAKDQVIEYLDSYNDKIDKEDDEIVYTDMAQTISDMTGGIMDGITVVLIAFASISLVVSLIMVGIITYISVLERTKEIGILHVLGARKKDITRVFNTETFIIGSCSGLLGIFLAWVATFPINNILYKMTESENVAKLDPLHAISLLIISVVLTMIGG